MSAYNCLKAKAASGKVPTHKGEAALKRIKEIREALMKQGEPLPVAQAMAEMRFADEAKHAATNAKWRKINRVRVTADLRAKVAATAPTKLPYMAIKMVDDTDFEARSIHKLILSKMGGFIEKHRVKLTGGVSEPLNFREFMRALHGEPTSNATAAAMAKAVNEGNEWIRKKMNSYGHSIGKIDNWGMAHAHNAGSIRGKEATDDQAFARWGTDTDQKLDWAGMINPKTGLEFGAVPDQAFRTEFLRAAFDNIIYGRNSKNPQWQQGQTSAMDRHRVLKFKTADDWIDYNDKYGTADPHSTLLQHWDQSSRQIALARRFGPDAQGAIGFLDELVAKKNRTEKAGWVSAGKGRGGVMMARNMVRVMEGGIGPSGYYGAQTAKFFSTTRKVLTGALLDRAAVIAVPSDMNSATVASLALGQNPGNWFNTYMGLMADATQGGGATRNELLNLQHFAESWANPGVTLARVQAEMPAAAWAETLSNGAMRIQGMNAHTDSAKLSMQWAMSGWMGSYRNLKMGDIPTFFRTAMERAGITPADWDMFRAGPVYKASNGAELLSPLHWQGAYQGDPVDADRLYLTFQSFVEKWQEYAVPSRSLVYQGIMDPKAWDMAPGGFWYESIKSAGMFKSFVGAFVVNQARLIGHMPTKSAKAAYILGMIGSTTLVGAVAIQAHNLLLGRDPQDMTSPNFIFQSMLRGGGLGPAGDLLATSNTSWGGGLPGYLAGPVPSLIQDVSKLSFGNMIQAYNQAIDGDDIDLDLMRDIMKFQSRYTPMWQTPIALGGIALDRMISDQLVLLLDPGALDGMLKAQKNTDNLNSRGSFWLPGSPIPNRTPNFGNAIGMP